MDKHLYLVSGMGADERMFQHLRFPDDYTVHFLPWLKPVPNESYTDYAARMAAAILHTNVTLLGVSFGGMICLEIARQRPVDKVILISSIKHTREKPPYFNWVRKMGLMRLPDSLIFKRRHAIVKRFLNTETEEERLLLTEYLQKKEYDHLRWAVTAVINWENEFTPAPLVHIHGGRDYAFPVRFIQPTYTIADGGHFMVLNRAAEINKILYKELG